MPRIEVSFSSPDPDGRELLLSIDGLPKYSPERSEAEAFLYTTLARAAWREADQRRELQARQERREARKRKP